MEEPWAYYTTEKKDWFDSVRHSGDNDFVIENEFVYIDSDTPVEEQELARPKDFEKCREWVRNMPHPEGNKKRLMEALDKLEKDESLVFTWSW